MPHPTTKVPNVHKTPIRLVGSGMTHKGLIRETNEDMILTDPTGALWAVADGMGGHGNGAFASDLVIDHLTSLSSAGLPQDRLEAALQAANSALIRNRSAGVAGATVVAALFGADIVHLTWAGDSRVYRMRQGELVQLTRDHSVVQDLLDAGQLNAMELESHPEAHVVTRAIGGNDTLQLDHLAAEVFPGDQYLLCSDGLTRCVSDTDITDILKRHIDPDQATRALLQAAMEGGAPDNVSAIVVVAEEL